jgi:ATPase subunit of ABC transporter with duplicated ATPase domains
VAEQELAGIRSGIVLISHDRQLLERFSRSTVWLDRGITRVLGESFSAFEAWREHARRAEADWRFQPSEPLDAMMVQHDPPTHVADLH